jgi:hypothetical protein
MEELKVRNESKEEMCEERNIISEGIKSSRNEHNLRGKKSSRNEHILRGYKILEENEYNPRGNIIIDE